MGGSACHVVQRCCIDSSSFAAPYNFADSIATSEGSAMVGPWQAKAQVAGLAQYYREWDSLVRALASSGVMLIRASWLEALQRRGGVLPRHQDLPQEAIWGARDLVHALGNQKKEAPRIVAISHSWLTREHPDPYGFHLNQFAPLLRSFARHCKVEIENVAVFIDWCSLPQRPRYQEEERTYSRALSHMDLWFAHWLTEVWMLTKVPQGVVPYKDRGWTLFERAAAALITPPESVLDLGSLMPGRKNWGQVIKDCQAERGPPLLPEAFEQELARKIFAYEEDRDIVTRSYRDTFHQVLGYAEQLWYGSLAWGDREAEQLAEVLPLCERLQELELQGNDIGDAGAAALAEVIPQCKHLKWLSLEENQITSAGVRRLRDAWVHAGKELTGLETGAQRTGPHPKEGPTRLPQAESPPRSEIGRVGLAPEMGTGQMSTLLARQAAFEARVDAAVARLTGNLSDVADAVGVRSRNRAG